MRQINTKTTDLFQSSLCLIYISALCGTLLQLFFVELRRFSSGNIVRFPPVPLGTVTTLPVNSRHPQLETEPSIAAISLKINFDEFGCYEHRFLDIPSISFVSLTVKP